METTLFLIRHGQTDANVNHMIQGQLIDEPLNDTGRAEALAVGRFFKDVHLDRIYSSPLRRARETAVAIHKYHRNVDMQFLPELKDRKSVV